MDKRAIRIDSVRIVLFLSFKENQNMTKFESSVKLYLPHRRLFMRNFLI